MSINRVVLTGRLTKDVEIRATSSGNTVVSFDLAVNRDKDATDFISCVAWNQQAKYLSTYCKKGNNIAVEGRIQSRSYDGKNGKVYVTEVVCDRVENLTPKPAESSVNLETGEVQFNDDDLPF